MGGAPQSSVTTKPTGGASPSAPPRQGSLTRPTSQQDRAAGAGPQGIGELSAVPLSKLTDARFALEPNFLKVSEEKICPFATGTKSTQINRPALRTRLRETPLVVHFNQATLVL